MPALTIPDPPLSLDVPRDHPRPHRLPPDAVYSHAHFDANGYRLPPSSAVFTHYHPSANWQSHMTLVHHNPYPPPQPPQLVHKVWILDCRSCATFLTNRGMKAVLLLRPNVSLFSTDALPVNCSAYSTNPDALRPPPCRPSIASFTPRTCECLTQTLCCHTCGAAVGYMIVIPVRFARPPVSTSWIHADPDLISVPGVRPRFPQPTVRLTATGLFSTRAKSLPRSDTTSPMNPVSCPSNIPLLPLPLHPHLRLHLHITPSM
jgi:hypothetical protein